MLYVILVGSILASLYELKQLKEKHYVREIVISSVLLTIGAILIILQIVNMELPSPLVVIQALLQPVSRLIAEILS
ncbi:hypothetical protein D3C76_783610 [compost metagenome]